MVLLASEGRYCPTVLRGRLNWSRLDGEGFQHGIYRLIVIEDGQHHLIYDDQAIQLTPGRAYLLQPNRCASFVATPNSQAVMVAFTVMPCDLEHRRDGRSLDPKDDQHCQPGSLAVWGVDIPLAISDELTPRISDLMRSIVAMWWQDEWHHYRSHVLLTQLLDIIVTYHHRSAFHADDFSPISLADRWRVLLQERLSTLQNTQDIADAFDLSVRHLSRLIYEQFQETPATLLRRARLEAAAELLQTSDWAIRDIASHVGYKSPAAMNHAWRRTFRLSPRQWRMNHFRQ